MFLSWLVIVQTTYRTPNGPRQANLVLVAICEQRRFRRACASAQSRQNLHYSLIQAVSQEELSDRKPDPWPLWMAENAQLKFVMTECSKTQILLTGLKCCCTRVSCNAALWTSSVCFQWFAWWWHCCCILHCCPNGLMPFPDKGQRGIY